MTRSRVVLALAVASGCLALLLLLLGWVSSTGVADDSGAGALSLVLGGLVVVGTLVGLGWRAVTRAPSDHL